MVKSYADKIIFISKKSNKIDSVSVLKLRHYHKIISTKNLMGTTGADNGEIHDKISIIHLLNQTTTLLMV
jgi:hypothetical protein